MIRMRPTSRFLPTGGIKGGQNHEPCLLRILIFCLLSAGLAGSSVASAASAPSFWQVGLRSTGYVYQTEDLVGQSESHFQGFQVITGSASGLGDGRFTLRGTGRFANDLNLRPQGFETSRLYNGYLEAKLSSRCRARVGRQLILGGAQYLTLDGAWMSWRPAPRVDLNLWGGARSPYGHGFEAGSLDEDSALGGRLAMKWSPRLRGALSLAINEREGHVAEQLLGLEATGSPRRQFQSFARVVYDLENEHWRRLQGQLRWRPDNGPSSASIQFVDRRPFIDPGSYFSRFANVERIRVVRASLRRERDSGFGGEFEAFGSYVDDRSASRLGAALLLPGGRVGYSVRMGDSGEENRFYGAYSRQVRPWLRAEGEATFQTYALFSDAPSSEDRELTTFSARLRAQLRPGLRVLAEVQSLDNPFYSKDVRFLMGVDLARAGGVANYGLGQGGWLK